MSRITDAEIPPGLADAESREAWTGTVHGFLSHAAATPAHLATVLERSPDCAMAHLAKGIFLLLLGRGELIPAARDAHRKAARILCGGGNSCERAWFAALGDWLDGKIARAADGLDALLDGAPSDALTLKTVHAIRFVLGDSQGMRRSLEASLPAWRDHPLAAYLNGCHAFALEETGDFRLAEARGRDAVLRAPDDAWGIHAVAHVFDMTARTREGIRWLGEQPGSWAHCNNFRYHVWWHLALFHLDRGETGEALRLYDSEIRQDRTDDYRDIANGASLLMRLELEGVDVGDRWEEMAALCEARIEDGCVVFADLHYLLALSATDREAASRDMLARLRRDSSSREGDMGRVARESGAEVAAGLLAFSAGDYANAFRHLSAARPRLHGIGGSHAQRDVFTRILIEAALRAGMLDVASAEIEARAARRGAYDGYAERRLARIGYYASLDAAAL